MAGLTSLSGLTGHINFFYKNAENDQIDWPDKFSEASAMGTS